MSNVAHVFFTKAEDFLRQRSQRIKRKRHKTSLSCLIIFIGGLYFYASLKASDKEGASAENDLDASACFIFSIDGEGIRGLIPAKIQEYVEQEATATLKKFIYPKLEKSGKKISLREVLQRYKSLTSLDANSNLIEDKERVSLTRAWQDRENFKTLIHLPNNLDH